MEGVREKKTEPFSVWNFTFWLIFLLIAVSITGLLWVLGNVILPPSITLAGDPIGFSPFLFGRVSFDYVGFVPPFIISIVTTAILFRRGVGGRRLRLGLVSLLIAAPISFLLSQHTVLGASVSLGGTDVVMMVALSIVLYYNILRLSSADSVLLAYPLGFILGFMSDIESAGYFTGVFGGIGLGDGDFLYPIAFVVAAYIFSKSWRRWFNRTYEWALDYDERRSRRRRSGAEPAL